MAAEAALAEPAQVLWRERADERFLARHTRINHSFCGAAWRVRRRLPRPMRPVPDAVREASGRRDGGA